MQEEAAAQQQKGGGNEEDRLEDKQARLINELRNQLLLFKQENKELRNQVILLKQENMELRQGKPSSSAAATSSCPSSPAR